MLNSGFNTRTNNTDIDRE